MPLFLILLSRHAAWTGQLTLFDELRDHVDSALEWISKYGDLNGDGYVEYESTSEKGLINQGWKDSGDAIIDTDGNLATPPIALVEVQVYVYMAKLALADLYERAREPDRAGRLRQEAEDLRGRFNRAIAEAALYFAHYQLPELFAGFGRQEFGVPVRYPVACHPQAWVAGSVPYLVETLLGLTPEAYERRLRITRPVLPDFVDRLEVHRLRVGSGRADLSFERTSDGVAVKVLKVEGPLDVIIDSEASMTPGSEVGKT